MQRIYAHQWKCSVPYSDCYQYMYPASLPPLMFQVFEHAWRTYKTLTEAQRRNLAIAPDDIIFLIPEDVSLFFDSRGTEAASLLSVESMGWREYLLKLLRFICLLMQQLAS
uniref:Uncharacterized protein n=1 Tax=Anguilla anguilla TaxID=7936 RepID=A0A0E9RIC6_ANGAN